MIAPAEAVALIPEDLPADEAAPLLCAGITVYNALRNSGAHAGDLVAVQGIGGLGHLGIQYARQMGFHTVAIGRGADKQALAKKLGRPQSFIAKYEGGERRIDVVEFIAIARALGADPVKLFRDFVDGKAPKAGR